MTIQELDIVRLTEEIPEAGLKSGDTGTIVMIHGNGAAFEVEFLDPDGYTIAVKTLVPEQLALVDNDDFEYLEKEKSLI